ncbi:MAG TPA: phospholipase D-like domain-containing protein [Gammaproteobacteria bacterium]
MPDSLLLGLVVVVFHVVFAPVAVVHALLYKRDYRSALGWIGISILFPVAGPLLYFFFGVNRLRQRARELHDEAHNPWFFDYGNRAARMPVTTGDDETHYLARSGRNVTTEALTGGNDVELLCNGDALYPRLIDAINAASRRVWISSYIFSGEGVGAEIAAALEAAAARGVDTKVLIDGVGALYSRRSLQRRLQGTAVRFAQFLPPRLLPPSIHVNLRNHRKIAVIDFDTAFFGGLNIDDRHFVAAPRIDAPHEDVHFLARGPVTAPLAELFARDWFAVTRERLDAGDGASACGDVEMRVIASGPDESLYRLAMTLLGVISTARRRIRIMTPYFLPHRELTGALQAAAVRGVRVEILLPEKSNLRYVDWASRHQLWEFLKWGVEVRLDPPPFAHSKVILVDDDYVMAGSANLDARSLRLNFEVGVEMFDAPFAARVHEYFDANWNPARPVTLADVDRRSLPARLRDGFFWLFSGYL